MLGTGLPWYAGIAQQEQRDAGPTELRIPVNGASLYARTIGHGPPVVVIHGGPDFDISYLLPEMDRLRDGHRFIYYDQRGRGRSAEHVRPEDVTLASDVADVDAVRQHFGLESPVLLGHSWGAVLAAEYALRHPTHVGGLILLNPAPLSSSDRAILRTSYVQQLGADMDRQREIMGGPAYQRGDPDAVIARYRIHFEHALARPSDYDILMARMDSAFQRQGAAGIVRARAVEDQLMRDTWERPDYDLVPQLRRLRVPTIVIASDHDFIPGSIAEHIAHAIPGARLVVLEDCGHFSYLECAPQVYRAFDGFFKAAGRSRQ
jgi:proline iminopeptidase